MKRRSSASAKLAHASAVTAATAIHRPSAHRYWFTPGLRGSRRDRGGTSTWGALAAVPSWMSCVHSAVCSREACTVSPPPDCWRPSSEASIPNDSMVPVRTSLIAPGGANGSSGSGDRVNSKPA